MDDLFKCLDIDKGEWLEYVERGDSSSASFLACVEECISERESWRFEEGLKPLGAVIEIRNLSACAMLVINCVQADANELFAFLGAHCCFTSLVSRVFLTTLDRIECGPVLWDLPR